MRCIPSLHVACTWSLCITHSLPIWSIPHLRHTSGSFVTFTVVVDILSPEFRAPFMPISFENLNMSWRYWLRDIPWTKSYFSFINMVLKKNFLVEQARVLWDVVNFVKIRVVGAWPSKSTEMGWPTLIQPGSVLLTLFNPAFSQYIIN